MEWVTFDVHQLCRRCKSKEEKLDWEAAKKKDRILHVPLILDLPADSRVLPHPVSLPLVSLTCSGGQRKVQQQTGSAAPKMATN